MNRRAPSNSVRLLLLVCLTLIAALHATPTSVAEQAPSLEQDIRAFFHALLTVPGRKIKRAIF